MKKALRKYYLDVCVCIYMWWWERIVVMRRSYEGRGHNLELSVDKWWISILDETVVNLLSRAMAFDEKWLSVESCIATEEAVSVFKRPACTLNRKLLLS